MKKLKVLVIIAILGSTHIFALENNTKMSPEKSLREIIETLLESPEIVLYQKEVKTLVKFSLNTKGEIIILNIDSKDESVINYVKSRLDHKKVNKFNAKGKNKVFILPLKIMVQ